MCVSNRETILAHCSVCFDATMHNSSQKVQGTNLLQPPAFHRLQCVGTLAIGLVDYRDTDLQVRHTWIV
jgi:hypothetical protein